MRPTMSGGVKSCGETDVTRGDAQQRRRHLPVTEAPPFILDILYQSTHFVAVNKPAGLPVHPSRETALSVEAFFPYFSKRKDGPWLVHRLDRDTSGCLLIALRKQALIAAQNAFSRRQVTKTYWAIVRGHPASDAGSVELPLLRVEKNRLWKMEVNSEGQDSHTNWRVLHRGCDATLLELQLLTGRTHQARAHCAAMGHPMIGDPIYGATYGDAKLLLHCRALRLHCNDEDISVTAPPSSAMADWIKAVSDDGL